MRKLSALLSISAFAAMAGLVATAAISQSKQSDSETPTQALNQGGMGPVCWAAIVESVVQIGNRCGSDGNPETIAALEMASEDLGRKFIESGWTSQELEYFRRQMGEADAPAGEICADEDAIEFVIAIRKDSPANIKAVTDEMLMQPDPPQWGTCL